LRLSSNDIIRIAIGLSMAVAGVVLLDFIVIHHIDEVLVMLNGGCCLVPGVEWLLLNIGALFIVGLGAEIASKALRPRKKT